MNDLIQVAREHAELFKDTSQTARYMRQLCDHAEAQAKEIEGMRAEIERLKQIRYNATEAHVSIQSRQTEEIEKLREQRDAAVTALEWYADDANWTRTTLRHGTEWLEPGPANADEGERASSALSHIKGGEG